MYGKAIVSGSSLAIIAGLAIAADCWVAQGGVCCSAPTPRTCADNSVPPQTWDCTDFSSPVIAVNIVVEGSPGKTEFISAIAGLCTRTPRTCGSVPGECNDGTTIVVACPTTFPDPLSFDCDTGGGGTDG